jgi:hypothetical protein
MSNFRAIGAIVGLLTLGLIPPATAQRTPRAGS